MFNKQKIAAVSAIVLFLTLGFTNCSTAPAEADQKLNIENTVEVSQVQTVFSLILDEQNRQKTMLEEEADRVAAEQAKIKEREEQLRSNTNKMIDAIAKLKKHLNSEYGYGDEPGYWDCSGLVRWFYAQQGIDLYHSATAESKAGKRVKHPKIGDIVAFHYGSANWSFHVGIYVGDGKVLHAYNPYADTVISDISEVSAENGAWASYTRIVQTN
jgi:cell wall-associated NlpC family hydrolase